MNWEPVCGDYFCKNNRFVFRLRQKRVGISCYGKCLSLEVRTLYESRFHSLNYDFWTESDHYDTERISSVNGELWDEVLVCQQASVVLEKLGFNLVEG